MRGTVEELSNLLREKNLSMVSAESCTGGMIAAAITDIPGSSDVFDRGFVTYSNAAKQDLLGVTTATLDENGAVSKECAGEMAKGALKNSAANIAVSVTGIAGPDGGTEEKPVGLVYIATCVGDEAPIVVQCNFVGDRAKIRALTCRKAYDLLIQAASTI